jgi:hypothetical protein
MTDRSILFELFSSSHAAISNGHLRYFLSLQLLPSSERFLCRLFFRVAAGDALSRPKLLPRVDVPENLVGNLCQKKIILNVLLIQTLTFCACLYNVPVKRSSLGLC